MTRKGTHDQGTTNGHPLLGRPRDNQRTPRDTPRTDPSETAPFQRSDQGTTNGQPTDSTRRPTKGQISPLYRGRLSPGHEFRNTHNNPKPATQRRIKPKETARDRNRRLSWTNGHPQNRIRTATHTGQASTLGDTHVHATPAPTTAFGGRPTPYRIEQARKQPDLVAASDSRNE